MWKICFSLFVSALLFSGDDIEGFWKTIDADTGKAQSVIAVYKYDGLYYGKMIGTFGDDGKINDSIYKPTKRAPGLPDQPFYCGLDIIRYLMNRGSYFKGQILNPQDGKVYNAELWTEDGNLIVRGKFLMFGRTLPPWPPATKADFPKDFKMPDLKKLVPEVPKGN